MYVDVNRNISEVENSQKVRLIADMLVIAPFLIYLSTKTEATRGQKLMLIAIATATIVYNTKNYIEYKKRFN